MKNFSEHLESLKSKPHHIRKQVAFGAAGAGAGLIALVWLVTNLSFGTFAISGSTFADAGASSGTNSAGVEKTSALAGAAAAKKSDSGAARIEIVDTASTTVNQKKAEPTIIPF